MACFLMSFSKSLMNLHCHLPTGDDDDDDDDYYYYYNEEDDDCDYDDHN